MGRCCWLTLTLAILAISENLVRAEEPLAAAGNEGIKVSGWQPIFKQMAEDYRIAPADRAEGIS